MDKIRSVDKIRLVQQGVYWMIVRSAKVGVGSGRGAQKLGKSKFRSHQSGALQLRQHLTEQVAGQRFERVLASGSMVTSSAGSKYRLWPQ